MEEPSFVTALIPAAGRGTRMGGLRKQYRNLGGKPLLLRTLELFAQHPYIAAIVLAVPDGDQDALRRMVEKHAVGKMHQIVAGGETRQASVAAALHAAPDPSDVVLVHDAVRPFVPPECVADVIEAARRVGAAALAIPVADTLRRVDEGLFAQTVDRRELYRMQTPQAFRRELFEEAHRAAQARGYRETDDVALVQRLGGDVAHVQGSTRNFKVTTPDDWSLAQALWAADAKTKEE